MRVSELIQARFSSQPASSSRRQDSADGRPLQLQRHEHTADGQRRAPAEVRTPMGEQRWTGQRRSACPLRFRLEADHRRDGDQGQCEVSDRVSHRQVDPADRELSAALTWRSSTRLWSALAR